MMKKLTIMDKRGKRVPPVHPKPSEWSDHLSMGDTLQVRARTGFRAAVVTLEPGLYLVTELSQEAMDEQPQEIGFAFLSLLSAGMITAATQALNKSKKPLNLAQLPKNLTRWLRKKRPDEDNDTTQVDSREDADLPRWLQKLMSRKQHTTQNEG